jgi:hypothetical protein
MKPTHIDPRTKVLKRAQSAPQQLRVYEHSGCMRIRDISGEKKEVLEVLIAPVLPANEAPAQDTIAENLMACAISAVLCPCILHATAHTLQSQPEHGPEQEGFGCICSQGNGEQGAWPRLTLQQPSSSHRPTKSSSLTLRPLPPLCVLLQPAKTVRPREVSEVGQLAATAVPHGAQEKCLNDLAPWPFFAA